ncbi:Uncharacterized protein dnm_002280 [Desulfonema magnum]|uniref:Uncharacterized protein n=1 Tax=Desulfonema magnum TaxID=45655 RepID=A0A975BFH3_9BACT|nr:Uncharacterized protein dnm_002280 [Desulfonema magnum]
MLTDGHPSHSFIRHHFPPSPKSVIIRKFFIFAREETRLFSRNDPPPVKEKAGFLRSSQKKDI